MINAQILQGQWNQVRGELKKRWGQLTDDDLRFNSGNIDQLVGSIQQRTGESREAIEQFLSETSSQGATAVAQAAGQVGQYARYAGDQVREGYNRISDQFGRGYDYSQEMIREAPQHSVATIFVAAFLLGVLACLVTGGLIAFGFAAVASGWSGIPFSLAIFFGLGLVTWAISSMIHSSYNMHSQLTMPGWLENLEVMRRYVADEPIMASEEGQMQ